MPLDIQQLIKDESGDRDYFAMVPGLLWPDIKLCSGSSIIEPLPVHVQELGVELNIYDKWLYASLKKICGEKGGQCFLSTRGLAKFAGMSVGQTSKSKAKLAEAGLIEIICKKRSVKGQAIDHITVIDVWEENVKLMKARKEGVHLMNALKAKQERSQKGEVRSRGEHQSPERSQSEGKCSQGETEEEPIEEEPRDEEEKEEEPNTFPEKRKERTDENPSVDDPDGRDRRGTMLGLDGGQSAKTGGITDAFPDGRSDGADIGKADPLRFDLARRSAAAQAKGGNFAAPPSAGGDDGLAAFGLFCLYDKRGKQPPKQGTKEHSQQCEKVRESLRVYGYSQCHSDIVEEAAKIFCERKGAWVNVFYRSFVADFGVALQDAEYFIKHGHLPNGGDSRKASCNDPDRFDRATRMTLERLGHGDR